MHYPGGFNVQIRLGFPRTQRVRITAGTKPATALLAALSVALAPVPAVALPSLSVRTVSAPTEQPALWVVSDADTTIYLFGTFHALDERTDWFGRDVRAAFASSDQLMLETLVPTDPIELTNALSRHKLAAPLVPGAPVIAGGPASTVAKQASQTMAAGRSAGLMVEHGADAVLRRTALAQGKPVGGLESFDFQLSMFTGLPAASPPARSAKSPMVDTPRLLLDMRSAWRRGDGANFARILASLEAQSPATYQRLFVDRNRDWASWIAERMDRPGTVFVAVGTGHLIGRDSVQRKLASRGYLATRIN